MKSSFSFGDRARQLVAWFHEWSMCEQTIVLYTLLSKVTATQSQFLSLVLEHRLKNSSDSKDLGRLKTESNNPAYLHSLHSATEDAVLGQLLSHLLLLHPGNEKARVEFLRLLPKVLLSPSEEPDYLDHCQQLLSLALLHPAFPHEDRETLTYWRTRLEDKRRGLHHNKILKTGSLPHHSVPRRIYQSNGRSDDKVMGHSATLNGGSRIYINGMMPSHPFNCHMLPLESDFEPPHNGGAENEPSPPEDEDDVLPRNLPWRSGTIPHHQLPVENCPTPNGFDEYTRRMNKSNSMPMPRTASVTSLPTVLDDQQPVFWKNGMKDVPSWLKTLRLHKYQYLFADMSYEDLLSVSEEFLESKSVTKGARNKIILSIRKLVKRPETLAEIDQEVEKSGQLLFCITELKQMLGTPLKPYASPRQPTTAGDSGDSKSLSQEYQEDNRCDNEDSSSSGGGSPYSSNSSSPRLQRSSSIGSDLDELLAKDFPQEDLPSLITRSLGKVFNQLMKYTETNEDNLTAFIKLLDLAMCHEAFTIDQRKLFFEWKQQCQQTVKVIAPRKSPRGQNWAGAFTFGGYPHNTPIRGGAGLVTQGVKSRRSTMRSSSGVKAPVTILSAPNNSSTLPRMTPRQLQQPPLPPPLVVRPKSIHLTSPAMNPMSKPFVPSAMSHKYVNLTIPRPQDVQVSEGYMDDLCKRVTDHALDDRNET